MKQRGVMYIATGEKYINEANLSSSSIKNHSDLPTIIWTDSPSKVNSEVFDCVHRINSANNDFGDSIFSLDQTPFEKTLFLDTDTYVCGDISSMFNSLDRFDVIAAHNPGSRSAKKRGGYRADVPEAFPQYNTGVVGFNSTDRVRSLFQLWEKIYQNTKEETKLNLNQPAFREALYNSNVRIGTLPSEYNFRIHHQGSVGFAADEVRIVHGRHPAGLKKIAQEINKEIDMRVYTPTKWPIEVINRRPNIIYLIHTLINEENYERSLKKRLFKSIKNDGVMDTLHKLAKWKQ